jgi:hypothetical protein
MVSGAENPDQLQVSLASGTRAGASFNVAVSAVHAGDSTSASDQKLLTYQPLSL